MGEKPENIFFRGDYTLYIDELIKIYSWYKDDLEATNGDANHTEESVFHIVSST